MISRKGLRQLGLATDGQTWAKECRKRMGPHGRHVRDWWTGGSWQILCQEENTEVSERDLILAPRFPRTLLMRLTELMSFHVCGLSHESRGVGPENGKASSPVDLN